MAKLVPPYQVDSIEIPAERDVARALLETLPARCTVYHSFPWLRPDRNSRAQNGYYLREGEADFVILDPQKGIMVVEVKGGDVRYDSDTLQYFRRVESRGARAGWYAKPITQPFEQARKNKYRIVKIITAELERKGLLRPDAKKPQKMEIFTFGECVIFPDCLTTDSPADSDSSILFNADHLESLGPKVLRAFDHFWGRSAPPSQQAIDTIKEALASRFKIRPSLRRMVKTQEDALARLTNEQYRLIESLEAHDRAQVIGVAGSGKTLLAKYKAEQLLEKRSDINSILLLCYNTNLAKWLEESIPSPLKGKLKVSTYHSLVRLFCTSREAKTAGMKFQVPSSPQEAQVFWNDKAPELLMEAIDWFPTRFDAVIVDEGQDFADSWWFGIELLNRSEEEGVLYVFHDPAQNLYGRTYLQMPDLGPPFKLSFNCRNTMSIAQACGQILDQQIPVASASPTGLEPEIRECTPEKAAQSAAKIVKSLINTDKFDYSQIAILSPFGKARSSLGSSSSIGKFPLVGDPNEWRNNIGVLHGTIKSFKGLEADAVILIDIKEPEEGTALAPSDFYVACSRAKHLLYILTSEPLDCF